MREKQHPRLPLLAGVAAFIALLLIVACARPGAAPATQEQQLKLGFLMSFTGGLASFGPEFENAGKLAIKHINDAGGVLGRPVIYALGDDGTSPEQGVAEARRLVDIERVNAIVGPLGSGVTIAVVESVTVPNRVLLVTPSATSPAITALRDNDYVFRTPISDAAQGLVLAQLVRDSGFSSACALYVNNAYGQGLAESFANAFQRLGGRVTARVSHEESAASFRAELTRCVEGRPEVLAAISYPKGQAEIYLREALEGRLIDKFVFVDGTQDATMFSTLGWDKFQGMRGTVPGSLDTEAGRLFDSLYEREYNRRAGVPFLRETYDAVVAIALAAEKAKSTDSTRIRDALRDVANAPGVTIGAGPDEVRRAFELVRAGQDIDYQGATGAVEFDQNGDISLGAIAIWRIEGDRWVTERTVKVDLRTGQVTPQ